LLFFQKLKKYVYFVFYLFSCERCGKIWNFYFVRVILARTYIFAKSAMVLTNGDEAGHASRGCPYQGGLVDTVISI